MKTLNNKYSFLTAILIFLFLNTERLYSQVDDVKINKLRKEAKKNFDKDDFPTALSLYSKLYELDPKDPYTNFYLGFTILAVGTDASKALSCFTYSYDHIKKEMPYTIRYLATAYHLSYRFEEAIKFYKEYKLRLSAEVDIEEYEDIKRKIEMCYNGLSVMRDSVSMKIENIGSAINTTYSEYSPVISADEDKLLFTSRRPSNTGKRKAVEGGYFEDIYISFRKDEKWTTAEKIEDIDTRGHDASISLSADGQTMFIYRQGDIYSSELNGNKWTKPKKLGHEINTSAWETQSSMAYHERELYFVSDRKGGYGGRDIYKASKLPNGDWGKVENLGPTINTPYDEACPFIHPDDKTLYFSSIGHNSMGGFDIFSTSYIEGSWTKPKNMGYPVNTPGDNLFFTVSAQGNHAYFSASLGGECYRDAECYGEKDIYMLTLPNSGNIPLTVVRGRIYDQEGKPIMANFTVTDNETKEIVGHYHSNSESGKYLLVFPPGKNYSFMVEANGYTSHKEHVYVPNQSGYYNLSQEIQLMPVKKGDVVTGQEVAIKNSFFDVKRATHFADSAHLMNPSEAFSAFLNDLENIYKRDATSLPSASVLKSDIIHSSIVALNGNNNSGLQVQSLIYTVQIGVYSRPITPDIFYNISPTSCRETSGCYTYSSGQFNVYNDALNRKNEIVNIGIKDAFVTAYYKGERITIANAIAIENDSKPVIQNPSLASSNFIYLY